MGSETPGEAERGGRAGLESRLLERFRRRALRAIADRHVFRYLAAATVVLSLASAVIVRVIDRRDFDSLGAAWWWSIQTIATVGYGDIVPHSTWGRVVASFIIVFGVTFISLLTAIITSRLVAADQDRRGAAIDAARPEGDDGTRELLEQVLERLAALEQQLARGGDAHDGERGESR